MIKFRCPLCLLKLKTADDFSEDYLTCPGCNEELEVPSPQYDNGELIDKYEIDMLLGQGNAGEVYLARDVILDQRGTDACCSGASEYHSGHKRRTL